METMNNKCEYLQPQAVEVEKAILGELMIDRDAYAVVSEILCPESFYEERNQLIYEAISNLKTSNRPVDIFTVTEELEHKGNINKVGGPLYVCNLDSKAVSVANIKYHAQIVAQKYLARQLLSFGCMIQSKASDSTVDVDVLMQEANNALMKIHQQYSRNDYRHVSKTVKDANEKMTANASCPDGITGIASGFQKLDNITKGWQPSDLIVIAGRTSMGKTAFALSCTKKIAVDRNIPTAIFTLEMSNVQLVKRLISDLCDIEGESILRSQLSKAERDRYDRNISCLSDAPLYMTYSPELNVGDFRLEAKKLVKEKDVKIIFIDNLQRMTYKGKHFNSKQEEVSEISKSLKYIAMELGIPIIVLSWLYSPLEYREGLDGERPRPSDLREIGEIEQNADVVIFLHRPEFYGIYNDKDGRDLHGLAKVIIAKNNNGKSDEVLMRFRGEYTRFENLED